MSLPEAGQVVVWYAYCDAAGSPALVTRYQDLLSPDERERQQRFRFQRDRDLFLVARVLVRTMLSHFSGYPPQAFQFQQNKYGKPRILEPAGVPLQFNLSHTTGMVACALTSRCDIGVDVEDRERSVTSMTLARRFFAPAEVAALESEPAEQQTAAFMQFWTLKEAYVKARGQGLSISLQDFAFRTAAGQEPEISFADGFQDDPAAWNFAQRWFRNRFALAVAIRRPRSRLLDISWREVDLLAGA
jgi:4'-phosphopantetheinyl transferase